MPLALEVTWGGKMSLLEHMLDKWSVPVTVIATSRGYLCEFMYIITIGFPALCQCSSVEDATSWFIAQ